MKLKTAIKDWPNLSQSWRNCLKNDIIFCKRSRSVTYYKNHDTVFIRCPFVKHTFFNLFKNMFYLRVYICDEFRTVCPYCSLIILTKSLFYFCILLFDILGDFNLPDLWIFKCGYSTRLQ